MGSPSFAFTEHLIPEFVVTIPRSPAVLFIPVTHTAPSGDTEEVLYVVKSHAVLSKDRQESRSRLRLRTVETKMTMTPRPGRLTLRSR